MLFLNRSDVASQLTLGDCIDAVAEAFAQHARGELPVAPGILGAHAPGGGFHIKTAALGTSPGYFAAKVNANFPDNQAQYGLPTIQGVIALFDLVSGKPLALLDSIEITILRTAAASAVAARHLAREDSHVVTICGCGAQGQSHLRALSLVRRINGAFAIDLDRNRATAFAELLGAELGIRIIPNEPMAVAVTRSDITVTCTSARTAIFSQALLRPGQFIAAVGADSPTKQELDPVVLARSKVVVDLIEQAATIGELHHAIDAGVMTESDVHAELGQIVAGLRPRRSSEDETFVFDSTGTALQDVAAAAIAYERAMKTGIGSRFDLS